MTLAFNSVISANMPSMAVVGGPLLPGLQNIGLSMKTVTPGLGTLLATVDYWDGDIVQTLNLALALTAGNAVTNVWPELWAESSTPPLGDFNLTLTYLGIVSGTGLVRLAF